MISACPNMRGYQVRLLQLTLPAEQLSRPMLHTPGPVTRMGHYLRGMTLHADVKFRTRVPVHILWTLMMHTRGFVFKLQVLSSSTEDLTNELSLTKCTHAPLTERLSRPGTPLMIKSEAD